MTFGRRAAIRALAAMPAALAGAVKAAENAEILGGATPASAEDVPMSGLATSHDPGMDLLRKALNRKCAPIHASDNRYPDIESRKSLSPVFKQYLTKKRDARSSELWELFFKADGAKGLEKADAIRKLWAELQK